MRERERECRTNAVIFQLFRNRFLGQRNRWHVHAYMCYTHENIADVQYRVMDKCGNASEEQRQVEEGVGQRNLYLA